MRNERIFVANKTHENMCNQAIKQIPRVDIKDMAVYTGLSLITKGLSATPLKLQKLLYYEQAWFMVFFGRENTLFEERPQAWVNGPVYPTIYAEYKDKVPGMCDKLQSAHFTEGEAIESLRDVARKMNLGEDHIRCLESVITLYGGKTQNQLIMFTHTEKPWVEKRESLMPYERSTAELSLDTMYQYYKDRHERNRKQ